MAELRSMRIGTLPQPSFRVNRQNTPICKSALRKPKG
jgi:hypothetical protein